VTTDFREPGNTDSLLADVTRMEEPAITQLGSDTRKMCEKNGLLPYIPQIDRIIRATHRGIEAITLDRTERFVDGDYEKLCFVIRLKGKTTEIAAARKKLRAIVYNSIPRDKRQLLRFTYYII